MFLTIAHCDLQISGHSNQWHAPSYKYGPVFTKHSTIIFNGILILKIIEQCFVNTGHDLLHSFSDLGVFRRPYIATVIRLDDITMKLKLTHSFSNFDVFCRPYITTVIRLDDAIKVASNHSFNWFCVFYLLHISTMSTIRRFEQRSRPIQGIPYVIRKPPKRSHSYQQIDSLVLLSCLGEISHSLDVL